MTSQTPAPLGYQTHTGDALGTHALDQVVTGRQWERMLVLTLQGFYFQFADSGVVLNSTAAFGQPMFRHNCSILRLYTTIKACECESAVVEALTRGIANAEGPDAALAHRRRVAGGEERRVDRARLPDTGQPLGADGWRNLPVQVAGGSRLGLVRRSCGGGGEGRGSP